jgi:hypothetical protein
MGLLLGLAGSFIKKVSVEEEVEEDRTPNPFADSITLSGNMNTSRQPLMNPERLGYQDLQP